MSSPAFAPTAALASANYDSRVTEQCIRHRVSMHNINRAVIYLTLRFKQSLVEYKRSIYDVALRSLEPPGTVLNYMLYIVRRKSTVDARAQW